MLLLKQAARAAFLDGRVYGSLGGSSDAMFRSLVVVAAAGAAFGFGVQGAGIEGRSEGSVTLMLLGFMTVLVGWLLWAAVAYLLGSVLLRGQAGFRDLMRSVGMAYGPGLLFALLIVPDIGGIDIGGRIALVSLFWMLGAGVVAVREAQGRGPGLSREPQKYGTLRAIGPTGVGWALAHILLPAMVFGPNQA